MNKTICMESATLHMVSSSHPFFCYSDSWTSSWSLLSDRVKDEFMLQTEWSLSIFKYLDKFDRFMDNKMQIINTISNADWQKSGDFWWNSTTSIAGYFRAEYGYWFAQCSSHVAELLLSSILNTPCLTLCNLLLVPPVLTVAEHKDCTCLKMSS